MHQTRAIEPPRKGFIALCAEEPFRIFFPIGLLAGVAGMLLWPLFYWGAWDVYPGVAHARLMIEGFLAAFIFGFLGTAGPRLLDAPRLSTGELGALLALHGSAMAFHLAGKTMAGDALFLGALLCFALILVPRFKRSETLPPPNFVLAGCGILSAIAGTVLLLWSAGDFAHYRLHALGNLLLTQGFVLFPVLGIGVFLFPRLLGNPAGAALMELRRPNALWIRKACIAAAAAFLITGSFIIEVFGSLHWAGALRFGVALAYVITQVPDAVRFRRAPLLGQSVRISMWLLLAGLLWPVLLPGYRVAGLHLVFIGGFMLVTLAVGTRVVLGHSGQGHLFTRRMPFLIAIIVLLVTGLLTRLGADFMPTVAGRTAHLIYAALLCIGAAACWGIRLVPQVFVPDEEE